uniref:Holin n=1 Tax=Pseudomonas phage Orisa03 TaxID=3138542 RepID=A0AAU6W2G2_9VIRU
MEKPAIMVGGENMADGLTTAAATLTIGGTGTAFIATMFPGVDLSAVIGAFGGAFFFVLYAKDISAWQRAGYLIVGWIGGYLATAELLAQAWTKTSGFSSFIGGLVCIVLCIVVVETLQSSVFREWVSGKLGKITGRGKPE